MKIQYLGTAAAEGWPGIFCNCEICKKAISLGGKNIRTRSQALIDDKILVDFPPDTYMHMLLYNIDLPNIHTLIVTHSHQDHWYPEDLMLRRETFSKKINGILNIYGNDKVYESFKEAQKIVGWEMAKNAKLEFHLVVAFNIYQIEGYKIIPLKALHNRKENCYIYIFERSGKCMLYGNDTGYFPEETWDFISNYHFDLVSLDCTLQKHKDGTNHMGIQDNIELLKRLEKIGCISKDTIRIANHFSHNGGMLHKELESTLDKYGIHASYDGMLVEI